MMPHNSSGPTHCRNSLSLDLDSRTKAAAWVWYCHGLSDVREGRFVSHTRAKETRESRFKVEAMQKISKKPVDTVYTHGVWDCDSKLYDTLELVSFTDRLDRSLMGVPSEGAPNFHHIQSPLHQSSGLMRTLSLPRNLTLNRDSSLSSGSIFNSVSNSHSGRASAWQGERKSHSSRWSIRKLVKVLKKVATIHHRIKKRGRTKCRKEVQEQEQEQPQPRHFHHHHYHHHHHHHHHHLYHLPELGDDVVKHQMNRQSWSPSRADSARLSSDTMSRICVDQNWV